MNDLGSISAEEIARIAGERMFADDPGTRSLGMSLVGVWPGRATLSMPVADTMVNGHGTCHGGFIFTLADSAFAFACNSHGQRAVAFHCSITYVQPAFKGDVLTAKAVERTLQGRAGIYDITVTRQNGDVVAEFRGDSRTIKGHWLEDEPDGAG